MHVHTAPRDTHLVGSRDVQGVCPDNFLAVLPELREDLSLPCGTPLFLSVSLRGFAKRVTFS